MVLELTNYSRDFLKRKYLEFRGRELQVAGTSNRSSIHDRPTKSVIDDHSQVQMNHINENKVKLFKHVDKFNITIQSDLHVWIDKNVTKKTYIYRNSSLLLISFNHSIY